MAWHWLRGLNWMHLLGLALIIIGAIYWPNGVTAANRARDLLAMGTSVTVTSSEVLVAEKFQRGGSTMDTIKVRVVLPGISKKVELRWINPPFGETITASFSPGWTTASAQTGYAAPFDLRYLQEGGETVAMAESLPLSSRTTGSLDGSSSSAWPCSSSPSRPGCCARRAVVIAETSAVAAERVVSIMPRVVHRTRAHLFRDSVIDRERVPGDTGHAARGLGRVTERGVASVAGLELGGVGAVRVGNPEVSEPQGNVVLGSQPRLV
jgi:hypothetical protein